MKRIGVETTNSFRARTDWVWFVLGLFGCWSVQQLPTNASGVPPDNDALETRTVLHGQALRIVGSTLDATREPAESAPSGADPEEVSVWYSWKAPRDGEVRVAALGSQGQPVARVRISQGNALNTLQPASPVETNPARGTFFQAKAGGQYELAVTAPAAVPSFFTLQLDYVATGSGLSQGLQGSFGDFTGTTLGALIAPELSDAPAEYPTVFWQWTAPDVGNLWVGMRHPLANFSVTIFRQGLDGHFVYAAGGTDFTVGSLQTEASTTYRIAVSSTPGAAGPFHASFTWSTLVLAGLDPGTVYPGHGSYQLYLTNRPPGVEFVTTLLRVGGSDPVPQSPPPESYTWQPARGGQQFLTVEGVDSTGRTWLGNPLSLQAHPANDQFQDAASLTGEFSAQPVITGNATIEPGEPSSGDSVWYRWSAPYNGTACFNLGRTRTTLTAAKLGVYQGTSVSSLKTLAEATTHPPRLLVNVLAGEEYYIRVAGAPYVADPAYLLVELQPPLTNDTFLSRTPLPALPTNVSFSAWVATKESTERGGYDGIPHRTAWYSLTPSFSGELQLRASGNDDSIVTSQVYRGTNLATLARQAWASVGDPYDLPTNILVLVSAHTNYQIQVDSKPGKNVTRPSPASLTIAFQPSPANDEFTNRLSLSWTNILFNGTLDAAHGESEGPSVVRSATTESPRAVWFEWKAPQTLNMSLVLVQPAGVLGHVFQGTNLATLSAVALQANNTRMADFRAIAGVTYALAFTSLRFQPVPTPPYHPKGEPFTLELEDPNPTVDGDLGLPAGLYRVGPSTGAPLALSTGSPPSFVTASWEDTTAFVARATNLNGEIRVSKPVWMEFSPANDNFEQASALTDPAVAQSFFLSQATREAGEPASAAGPEAPSVWWRWTAPFSGEATWKVSSATNVTATVYSGATLVNLQPVAEDSGLGVTLRHHASQGTSYYLAVTGNRSASGSVETPSLAALEFANLLAGQFRFLDDLDLPLRLLGEASEVDHVELLSDANVVFTSTSPPFHLQLPAPFSQDTNFLEARVWFRGLPTPWATGPQLVRWQPRNNFFAYREPLQGHSVDWTARLAHCGLETGEPTHGLPDAQSSVWWSYTPTADGVLEITSLNGLQLALYTGSRPSDLVGVVSGPGRIRADVQGGIEYSIAVASAVPTSRVSLSLRFAPTGIPSSQGVVQGTHVLLNTFFGRRSPEPSLPQIRSWQWTPSESGFLALSWDDASPLTRAGVVRDLSDAAGRILDPVMNPDSLRVVRIQDLYRVEAGHPYEIAFTLPANVIREFQAELRWLRAADHDPFADPPLWVQGENWIVPVLTPATIEPGEPATRLGWPNNSAGSVWIAWTAPSNGVAQVDLSSQIDVVVATGDLLDALDYVFPNAAESRSFPVETGRTYRVAMAALRDNPPYGVVGLSMLSHDPIELPPTNDLFANRAPLKGTKVQFSADTRFASREKGEPNHAGIYSTRSVWWSWTPPYSGQARIVSLPHQRSPYQIAVYSGDSFLTSVGSQAFGGTPGDLSFRVEGGTVYSLALDGYQGTGVVTDLQLSLCDTTPLRFARLEVMTNGSLRFHIEGPIGSTFRLEGSQDLISWVEAGQGTLVGNTLQMELSPAQSTPLGFFRLVIP